MDDSALADSDDEIQVLNPPDNINTVSQSNSSATFSNSNVSISANNNDNSNSAKPAKSSKRSHDSSESVSYKYYINERNRGGVRKTVVNDREKYLASLGFKNEEEVIAMRNQLSGQGQVTHFLGQASQDSTARAEIKKLNKLVTSLNSKINQLECEIEHKNRLISASNKQQDSPVISPTVSNASSAPLSNADNLSVENLSVANLKNLIVSVLNETYGPILRELVKQTKQVSPPKKKNGSGQNLSLIHISEPTRPY